MSAFIKFKGLFTREVARYLKVPLQTLGAPVVSTTLYLLIFGVSLGRSVHIPGGIPYLAFLIPGLIAMSVIHNAFNNATSSIMGHKYVNELQDLRIAPLTGIQISCAKSLAALSRGLFIGFITYIVGQFFFLQDSNSIAELLCFFEVVSGEQNRDVFFL